MRLMAACRRCQLDAVLVWRLDPLGRLGVMAIIVLLAEDADFRYSNNKKPGS
jgi:DNA invertase Pin-like site-specific DNA recombinase